MIEVAIAGDAAFTKQVAITLASLSATTSEDCRVFVLHGGYSDEIRDRLAAGTTGAVQIVRLYAPSAGTGAALRRTGRTLLQG